MSSSDIKEVVGFGLVKGEGPRFVLWEAGVGTAGMGEKH